jgi:hypothetical protein
MQVDDNVMVACCYCGRKQAVPPPPGLVTCIACEKGFRTLVNYSGGSAIEITEVAKRSLTGKGDVA